MEADQHREWIERVVRDQGGVIRSRFNPNSQQRMRANAAAWRRWNPDDDDVQWVLERYTDGIHRNDLGLLACELDTRVDRRRAFVATLVWGAGSTNRYYGRHSEALSYPHLDEMLRRSVDAVRQGELGQSWNAMSRLPGLQFRFFTKWLWVAGANAEIVPRPLVFDQRVIDGLKATAWPYHPRRINYRQRWLNYCADADAVAKQLGVTGEWIEYWLFCGGPHAV